MYLNAGGTPFAAGHESAGVTSPATEWFLAEGATGIFFDLFILIANPNDASATVDARYLLPDGSRVRRATPSPATADSTSGWTSRTHGSPARPCPQP